VRQRHRPNADRGHREALAAIEAQRGAFVARVGDLDALRRWHRDVASAILTVFGPAGVGKTRLARRFAAAAPARVVWCDLVAAKSADELQSVVARAFCQRDVDVDADAALCAALDEAPPALIVLDNFEHLIECGAALVERWARRTSAVRWLVTARETLGVDGERRYELASLDEEASSALFTERARAVAPEWSADDPAQRLALSTLVRRLDGLPLAIELAAARVEVLSLTAMLARLDDRFALLRSTGRRAADRDTRHDALRAAIDWSWGLLSLEERGVLARCSVFRGAFSARAAEAVIVSGDARPGLALDALQSLRRKSLLCARDAGDEPRLTMLESVRAYAAERLDAMPDAPAVRDRHAELALDELQRDARAEAVDEALAAFDHALDRAPPMAGALALALDAALYNSGPFERHLRVLDAALGALDADGREGVTTAKLRHARGRALRVRDRLDEATADLTRARDGAVACGDHALLGRSQRMLGVIERHRGALPLALEHLRAALSSVEGLEDRALEAAVLDDLGVVRHDLGELDAAGAHYRRSLALHRELGDRRYEGIARGHLGLLAHDLGDLELAERELRAALALLRAQRDRRFEGFVLGDLANVLNERGALDEAVRCAEAAVALYGAIGDGRARRYLLATCAAAHAASGSIVHADELLERARAATAETDPGLREGQRRVGGLISVARARAAITRGESERAARWLDDARAAAPTSVANDRFIEARIPTRLLFTALRAAESSLDAVEVAPDGSWFRARSGAAVSLARRPSLAAILAALTDARVDRAERELSLTELFVAGWPGQRIAKSSADRRVYVALDTLRRLGLGAVIVHSGRGYSLDPSVPVRVVAAPRAPAGTLNEL
jgi:predicted ATPase